jgi:non-heme chloroperoxidase
LAVVSVTTEDLKSLEVPMFIAHGDDDQIVPIAASAQKSAELVKHSTLKVYPGAPHGIGGPYQEAFDTDLLEFISN